MEEVDFSGATGNDEQPANEHEEEKNTNSVNINDVVGKDNRDYVDDNKS